MSQGPAALGEVVVAMPNATGRFYPFNCLFLGLREMNSK